MQISVQIQGLDEVVRRFRRAPEVLNRYMRRFMNKALPVIEREVKKETPVNTGALRSSVTHEVRGTGAQMQGIVGSPKHYAPYVEEGTRPHWPPRAPIEYWVRRKLHPPAETLYSVTRGVQRAIAQRGTKAARMFQKGFEATADKVGRMWGDVWGEAVEREL